MEPGGKVLVNGQSASGELEVAAGETLTLEAVPNEYEYFAGWAGALSGEAQVKQLVVDYEQTVTAAFNRQSRSLTVDWNEALGSVFINNKPYTTTLDLPAGQHVNLQVRPAAGYSFDGWGGDLSGARSAAGLLLYNDMTVTADFIEGGAGVEYSLVGPVPFRPADGADEIRFEFNSFDAGPFEIEVFSLSGNLIFSETTYDDPYSWNVRNNSGDRISSGHYIFRIKETTSGDVDTGRIVIIR